MVNERGLSTIVQKRSMWTQLAQTFRVQGAPLKRQLTYRAADESYCIGQASWPTWLLPVPGPPTTNTECLTANNSSNCVTYTKTWMWCMYWSHYIGCIYDTSQKQFHTHKLWKCWYAEWYAIVAFHEICIFPIVLTIFFHPCFHFISSESECDSFPNRLPTGQQGIVHYILWQGRIEKYKIQKYGYQKVCIKEQ